MEEGKQKVAPSHCDPVNFLEASKMYPQVYALFYSDMCEPCEELIKKARATDIPFPVVEVPADECSQLAEALNVDVVPTVVLVKRGKVKKIIRGSPDQIIKKMVAGK